MKILSIFCLHFPCYSAMDDIDDDDGCMADSDEELLEEEESDDETYICDVRRNWEALKNTHTSCCSRRCSSKISEDEINAHLSDLSYAHEQGYAPFWFWIRTLYLTSSVAQTMNRRTKKKRNKGGVLRVVQFLLPSIKVVVCRRIFTILLGIHFNTLSNHCSKIEHAYPVGHKLQGRPSNYHISRVQHNKICSFVLTIAEEHGLPNPRFAFSTTNLDKDPEVIPLIMLPPCFSMRTLHNSYCCHYTDEDVVSRKTFAKVSDSVLCSHAVIVYEITYFHFLCVFISQGCTD